MAIKIPFAYSLDLKRIVEVAEVPSGRGCNCICICCKQAMQARKGDKNAWCFSHDPAPGEVPNEKCDISFLVSARQFIADAALSGDLPNFTTTKAFAVSTVTADIPGLDKRYLPTDQVSVKLSDQKSFKDIQWEKGPGNYELSLVLPGTKIHIYLAYPGKNSPELPDSSDPNGYLLLDIRTLEAEYDASGGVELSIVGLARDLFVGTEHKQWIHHPRLATQSFKDRQAMAEEEARHRLALEHKARRPIRRVPESLQAFYPRYNEEGKGAVLDSKVMSPAEISAARRYPRLFEAYQRKGHSPKNAAMAILRDEAIGGSKG